MWDPYLSARMTSATSFAFHCSGGCDLSLPDVGPTCTTRVSMREQALLCKGSMWWGLSKRSVH